MALEKVGGLWFKEGKNGEFLAGPITILGKEIQLFLFPKPANQRDNPDYPDYTLHIKKEEEQKGAVDPKFVPASSLKY